MSSRHYTSYALTPPTCKDLPGYAPAFYQVFYQVDKSTCQLVVLENSSGYMSEKPWWEFKKIVFIPDPNIIVFNDPLVKSICIAKWDTNNDGELSIDEAASVTDLSLAFSKNSEITSFDELQYFTGLTTLEDWCFSYCSNLKSCILPSSLTSIGKGVFDHCTNLKNIQLPDGLKTIPSYTFAHCSSLETVNLPQSIEKIELAAFNSCSELNTISMPLGVSAIGQSVFSGCSNLTSIEIPDNIKTLEFATFSGCTSLSDVKIPQNLETIDDDAFRDCSSIEEIILPCTLSRIGNYAFSGCSGLKIINSQIVEPFAINNNVFS